MMKNNDVDRKGWSKWRIALIVVAILGIIILVAYLYYKIKNPDFPIKNFLYYVVGITLGVFLLVTIIMFTINHFQRKKRDGEGFSDVPKIPVDSDEALNVWMGEFVKKNNVPYTIQAWNNDKLVTVNKDALTIRNNTDFIDPSKQTGDNFYGFDCIVRDGDRTGACVVIIRLDRGLDWIRKNWNRRIKDNFTLNTAKLDFKNFPLSSANSFNELLAHKKIEMLEAGYEEDEVRETLDPFKQSTSQPIIVKERDVKKAIKSEELSDAYPNIIKEADDDVVGVNDLQKDIENYRRRDAL